MQEEEEGGSWLLWLLIVPVCMAGGAYLARWALHTGRLPRAAAPESRAEAPAPPAAPAAERPADGNTAFALPGDEPSGSEAAVVWGGEQALPAGSGTRSKAGTEPAPASDGTDPKASRSLGLTYGAISKAVEKLLNSPKAVSVILNNEHVVNGFLARDTVKTATANPAALAAYLKNPANLSRFMGKPAVQGGLNSPDLVNAVASSRLVGALLDTPGGRALLSDPAAIAGIVKSNPGLVDVLKNPNVLNALVQNPRTAGIATNLMTAGMAR